jgi:hypothetical protein
MTPPVYTFETICDRHYTGITTYDKGMYGKNGCNDKQPSNACHRNNIMVK